MIRVSRRDESASGLCKISRPDQVISSQVIVSFGEPPGYGETGDHGTGVGLFLVRSEDGIADAVEVRACLVHFAKIHSVRLDSFPAINKSLLDPIEIFQQCIPCLQSRLIRGSSKSESRNTLAIVTRQVQFRGQSNVSVRRCGIFPCHLFVSTHILPTIAYTYVSAEIGRASCRERV